MAQIGPKLNTYPPLQRRVVVASGDAVLLQRTEHGPALGALERVLILQSTFGYSPNLGTNSPFATVNQLAGDT